MTAPTREQVVQWMKLAGFDDKQWSAMTYDSGTYEITTPKHAAEQLITIARADLEQENAALREQLAAVNKTTEDWASEALASRVNLKMYRSENASLKRQLAAAQAEIERLKISRENFAEHAENSLQQLAAAELHIQRLREAMNAAWKDGYCFFGPEGYTDAQALFLATLASPFSPDALREHVTKQLGDYQTEISRLRAIKFARFTNEDCWVFQDNEEDNLDSLVCPIVMSVQTLREHDARLVESEAKKYVEFGGSQKALGYFLHRADKIRKGEF